MSKGNIELIYPAEFPINSEQAQYGYNSVGNMFTRVLIVAVRGSVHINNHFGNTEIWKNGELINPGSVLATTLGHINSPENYMQYLEATKRGRKR